MRTFQVTVGTTQTLLFDSTTYWRECHIHNLHGDIFIGGDGVTTLTGAKMENGSHDVFQLSPTEKLYAIVETNSAVAYCLETNK